MVRWAIALEAIQTPETLQTLTRPEIVRWRFTVDDYDTMRKSGVLSEDDRVELIEGEVRMMDVDRISPLHAGTVNRLQAILFGILGSNVIISVHNPVQLDRYNQPEPDFAILKPRHDFYKNAHPTPADVLLIIEVADTSVAYDRLEKMPRYAAAGIPEVWLLNALEKYIEQYSEPTPSGYGRMQRLGIDAVIKATQIEGLELPISQMLSNEEK